MPAVPAQQAPLLSATPTPTQQVVSLMSSWGVQRHPTLSGCVVQLPTLSVQPPSPLPSGTPAAVAECDRASSSPRTSQIHEANGEGRRRQRLRLHAAANASRHPCRSPAAPPSAPVVADELHQQHVDQQKLLTPLAVAAVATSADPLAAAAEAEDLLGQQRQLSCSHAGGGAACKRQILRADQMRSGGEGHHRRQHCRWRKALLSARGDHSRRC